MVYHRVIRKLLNLSLMEKFKNRNYELRFLLVNNVTNSINTLLIK
jgi:hypothetical protein